MMTKKRTIAILASMIIGINTIPMCGNDVYADDVVSDNIIVGQLDITDVQTTLSPISYRIWDDNTKQLIDAKPCTDYVVVTDSLTDFYSDKTYVVNSDVTIIDRIVVHGNVNLVLCDESVFTALKGLNVTGCLSIYGQINNTGQLLATGDDYNAGIGGNDKSMCGAITISGGNIIAKGGAYSAGIGGGYRSNGGNVTINGGIVEATGGVWGAGIGGTHEGGGGNVIINGGQVITKGGSNSSGIGRGCFAPRSEEGVLILGNNVKLEISTNGKDWINVDTTETRTTYMKTSTINIEPTKNEPDTSINYIDRIKELEEENTKLKEENNNLQRVLASYGNRAYGDMNNDNIVDGRDATILLTYYAKTSVGYVGSLDDFIKEQNGDII